MSPRISSKVAVAAILAVCGTASAQFYEYQIVAKAGQAGLTGMGEGPSITDGLDSGFPYIAFTGQTAFSADEGECFFVGDGHGDPTNISESLTASGQNLSPTCKINDDGTVAIRWTSPNPNGPT